VGGGWWVVGGGWWVVGCILARAIDHVLCRLVSHCHSGSGSGSGSGIGVVVGAVLKSRHRFLAPLSSEFVALSHGALGAKQATTLACLYYSYYYYYYYYYYYTTATILL
jgi:hypothetical protein